MSDGRNSVGTWYDKNTNQTYLDVVVTVPDKGEAMRLARLHKQLAVYDLEKGETIELKTYVQPPTEGVSAGEGELANAKVYQTTLPSVLELPELVGLAADLMGGKYPEIMAKLAKSKHLGHQIAGIFVPKEGKIKLSPTLFTDIKQVLYVLGHELGHLIDWLPDKDLGRGNLLGRLKSLKDEMHETVTGIIGTNEEIKTELKSVSQTLSPFDENKDPRFTQYRYSSIELYADAFTALINNPKMLRDKAPKFYDAFFEHLSTKPEVERLYAELQDSIKSGTARTESVERLRQSFRDGDRKEFDLLMEKTQHKESWQTALIDKNWFILSRILKSPYYHKVL